MDKYFVVEPADKRGLGRVNRSAIASVILLLGISLTGCGVGHRGTVMVSDEALNAKIRSLANCGASAPLRDLTDFDWDNVFTFYEGTSNDAVNEAVGAVVLRPGPYFLKGGALAVFVRDGAVVKLLLIPGLDFIPGRHTERVMVDGRTLVEPDHPTPGPPAREIACAPASHDTGAEFVPTPTLKELPRG
jgi:hypothetical protein